MKNANHSDGTCTKQHEASERQVVFNGSWPDGGYTVFNRNSAMLWERFDAFAERRVRERMLSLLGYLGGDDVHCAHSDMTATNVLDEVVSHVRFLEQRAREAGQASERTAAGDLAPLSFERGDWTTLDELPNGCIFENEAGIRAVKSEYHYPAGAPQCVLLASGEYAHFPAMGQEKVRPLVIWERK